MKVAENMILVGSLVTHSDSGAKGIVLKVDENLRLVYLPDINDQKWFAACALEWSDDEVVKPAKKEPSNSTAFTSRYDGDGTGKFMVGGIARVVILNEIDYHAVAQLLNEAYRVGRKAAAWEFLERAQQWAEGA